MSNFFQNEKVPVMPGLSKRSLWALADQFLHEFIPESLERPGPVDLVKLVETILPNNGVHVLPASPRELRSEYGVTLCEGTHGSVEILIRDDIHGDLYKSGKSAHFARSTVAHELGHSTIHVPVARYLATRTRQGEAPLVFARRQDLKPWHDPEWQSWCWAGELLIPRGTLEMLDDQSPENVSRVFRVSFDFARNHLKRLGKVVE